MIFQLPRLPLLGRSKRMRVGIDLGSAAIKILRTEAGRGGQWQVAGWALEPVTDPTPVAQKTALQRAIAAAGVPAEAMVALSASGQDVMTRYLTLPKMTRAELDGAIRFEGESYIPFPLNEVVLDKQILTTLDENKMRVLLVAGKRETLLRRASVVRECGLRPILMDIDALALVNAYLADQSTPPPATVALAHIGARYTNVAVLHGGQTCCFTRDLTVAGYDLTKTMAEQLGVSTADAERLKWEPGERSGDVGRIIRQALELLASELRLSLDFYESQFEGGVERLVLCGGTALISQVPALLQEHLGLPVTVWSPLQWLTRAGAQVPTEAAGRLAICVGLVAREDWP